MAAGDLLSNIELISPSQFAKEKIQAVQDYALLSARAVANLFRRPLYVADMIQQADLIGVGLVSIVLLRGVLSTLSFGIDWHQYWSSGWQILVYQDVFTGLVKPVLFGFIISTVGCYYGMSAHGGTQGVGRATTQAVVASSLLVVVVDTVVTRLLMTVFGTR